MAIPQKQYSRKLSPIERASLALNDLCKYNVELVMEGYGTLNPDMLRRAVGVAAQANPGSRVRLRGALGFTRWVDSGVAPEVRELHAPGWDARSERGAPFLDEKFDALGGGAVCDVIYVHGSPTRIVFRALHAAVDGRSLLYWITEVFRALRGEPLSGSPCTYIDWDIMRKFQDKVDIGALSQPATEPNIPVIHCSAPRAPGAGYVWRTLVLPTLIPNVLSKLAVFLAQWARRHASGQVSFIVPVDLRTLREDVPSLGNLTGYLIIPIEAGDTTRHFSRQLSLRIRQHADCHRPKVLGRLPWVPMWLIRRAIRQNLERTLYEPVPDATSGGVVSMGTFPLAELSTPQFKCTLTVPVPGFSGKLNVVVMPNEGQTVTTFAAPESYNLDGQLDELVAAFERQFGAQQLAEAAGAA
jgi:hypothetical protein